MKLRQRFSNLPIRMKLILTYVLTALFILAVNIFIYANVNRLVSQLDAVYVTNINLNELSAALDDVQNGMTEYLDTKSTDAMNAYYQATQDYSRQTGQLSDEISSEQTKRMERNIRRMSDEYLLRTDAAIEAKRGRNIEKYREHYEDASELYRYLKICISSLNNDTFRSNSADFSVLNVSLRYIEIMNIVVFVVIMIVNIILAGFIVRRITRPLDTLVQVAERVTEGDYSVRLPETETLDEIGVLNESFSRMLDSIRNGIVTEARLKEAQLQFLQAQINPHFLFNTLNAGAQLAMMEDADRTYEYIQTVADFYRYNIKQMDAPVPLSEEIKMVDSYIYILNIRFSNEITYEKEISETRLLTEKIPAMSLQPIVENAINHGIRDIQGQGRITLAVFEHEGRVCAKITDNGVGMTAEKIREIFARKSTEPDSVSSTGDTGGIGMHNVIGRLEMMYDTEDVCEITSGGENQGTSVLLKFGKIA